MRHALLACLLLLAACGEREAPKSATPYRRPWSDDDIAKPAWISDPTAGGTRFASWGSVQPDPRASRSDLRDRAADSARRELARMVMVRIQAVMKDWLAETGSGVSTLTEQVSRSIAVQNLAGTAQRDEWIHPKTGEIFVLVVLDPAYQEAMAAEVAKAARSQAAADPAVDAHTKAKLASDDAFRELDRLLDQPRKP
jgi:hypothetical protein